MKYILFLWLATSAFSSSIHAAGAPCFSHETFDHIGVPGAPLALTNSATDNYTDAQISRTSCKSCGGECCRSCNTGING